MRGFKFLKYLEVPVEERQTLSFLKNPDLVPIPKSHQTWGFWSNFAYWGTIAFTVGTWMGATAALTVGLSYPETIATFILGNALTIVYSLANCYPGWDWKVGYTLSQRFTFGIYGSAFGVIIRVLLSIVNYGSNAWILIIACAGTCFSMLGIIIYLCHANGGAGSLFHTQKTTVSGSDRAWAWVYMISYWFGAVSPGAVNQSDYSRFGSSLKGIYLGTIVGLMIPPNLVPAYGVIGASTTQELYGESMWMPTEICNYWLNHGYHPAARAASFFCGVFFALSQIAYTISNAGFASGMDLAGLLPKYVNIKRGAFFTAIVSVAVQPWNFYNSSSTFLTVMSSFGVVMVPILAVMICDNFIIRKRNYSASQAFILKGEYYFTKGFNWRAFIAMIVPMAPGLPGIAWQVNHKAFNNRGIVNFYYGDSFFAFVMSFCLYWILCIIFPFKINVLQDDKDYYGAFDEKTAIKKGMVPYNELTEAERQEYFIPTANVVMKEEQTTESDSEISRAYVEEGTEKGSTKDGIAEI
ncbi:hypothetical protein J6895_05340 [Nakaseomyces glabratus]|nr:hypothetical protein J6895_05340 [Nakaseomyces glabratus]